VIFAAQGIASGFHDLVVAGGVESTSRWLAAFAAGCGQRAAAGPLPDGSSRHRRGLIASREGFTRDKVDEFAFMSHWRAAEAVADRRFDRSLPTRRSPTSGSCHWHSSKSVGRRTRYRLERRTRSASSSICR
jgi:acetyl-CoA acetyltransferase